MSEPIETRFVAMSEQQADLCESFAQVMLASGDPDGTKLLALYLAWKYAPQVTQIPMEEHSRRVAERMVGELESERARLRVLDGGAA